MAFVRNNCLRLGAKAVTTKRLENTEGYMEPNTPVTIINISEKGYDIADEDNNIIRGCDWKSIKENSVKEKPNELIIAYGEEKTYLVYQTHLKDTLKAYVEFLNTCKYNNIDMSSMHVNEAVLLVKGEESGRLCFRK